MSQPPTRPLANPAAAGRFVADATLFLATLDVEPVQLLGRQLPPRAITLLQHQFHQPDPARLRRPGRPVERDHPRLACLHWVCHAAQLIGLDPAPPGAPALLLPTTRVAGWLNLPLPQQIAFLVEALNSPGAAALWRAYRLPGYRALTDESDLRPLTQHLLTARATTRFASVHLTRLLTIPLSPALLSPSPDAQPETLARAIWQAFLWMGLRREHARAEHARAKSSSAHPSPLPIPPSSLQGTLLHMPPEAHTTAWPLGPLSPPQRFALRHHATHRAEAGIVLVADLFPGVGSSRPQSLLGLNGVLYFSATGPDGARTLWRSDGTAAGTQPVRSDADAPMNPTHLTLAAGQLIFSAADAAHGREVWRSDGTAAGTSLLQDLVPGVESSLPQTFIATRKHLYLTAYTEQTGNELWAMPLAEEPVPPSTPSTPSTPEIVSRMYLPMTLR